MKLKKLVKQYNAEHDNCSQYEAGLMRAALRYRGHAGTNKLKYKHVNEWLTDLQEDLTSQTVKNYRQNILTLWNYAAGLDHCSYPDQRRIKRIKVTLSPHEAWSTDQVHQLCRVAPNAWWKAIIMAGYDTGLRRGDLLHAPRTIDDGRPFVTVERKTGLQQIRQLSDYVAELLRALPEHDLAFPWQKSLGMFSKEFSAIVADAVLTGTFKYLRRSFVTLSGWRHANPNISRKHYIDQTLVDEPVPRPPVIS